MRIGDLAERTGVSSRLLRYYEEQGLLRPARNASGYRDYSEEDLAAVVRVRRLLAAGLPTAMIATVLPCLREDGTALVPTCPDLLADLRRERERIAGAIADLTASHEALDRVISAADGV